MFRLIPAVARPSVRTSVPLVVVAAALWAGPNDVVFTKPVAGSVFHVGETVRVEFKPVDSTVSVCRDMMGFSPSDGLKWYYLDLFLNCSILPNDSGIIPDTITLKGHYDWVIPDSVISSRNGSNVCSPISQTCSFNITDYEPIRTRGQSATFIIEPRSAAKSPAEFRSFRSTETPSLYLGTPLSLRSVVKATLVHVFSLDGRERKTLSLADGRRTEGARVMVLSPAPAR